MHKKKAGKLQTGSTFPKQYWLAVNGKPKKSLAPNHAVHYMQSGLSQQLSDEIATCCIPKMAKFQCCNYLWLLMHLDQQICWHLTTVRQNCNLLYPWNSSISLLQLFIIIDAPWPADLILSDHWGETNDRLLTSVRRVLLDLWLIACQSLVITLIGCDQQ